tara:strand:+ start:88 stop:483 length:396 start_codon:yes stop_codon:yes gene_type:complete
MTQSEWDTKLITAFYQMPSKQMYMFNLDNTNLKRTYNITNRKMTVAVFINAYLPKLGNVLWKCKIKDVDRIVKILSKSKMDSLKIRADYHKARDESKIRKKSKINTQIGNMTHEYIKNIRNKTKYGWGVCS